MFGADTSSSVYIDNNLIIEEKYLNSCKGLTQGLDDTTLTAETQYSINLQDQIQNFVSACIIMEATVSYLLMSQKDINSKQDSEIKKMPCF